ncbi:MAG: enoyl-CoA hydratase/isomerase family protein [Candidatus Nanopelagicales bacterium]
MTPLRTIRTELRDTVLIARIDNPPTDLMDREVMADLGRLGRALSADRSVRAVVVTGPRPGVFVPHYLIDEILAGTERLDTPTPYGIARGGLAAVGALARFPGGRRLVAASPAAGLLEVLDTHAALTRLGRLPQVVIAAVDGDAQGGGCELALACDIRVMSDGDYLIGLPELSIGIPPGAGGTQRLMAAVGPARARALVLSAQTVPPAEALRIGLVDVVVPGDRTLAVALEIAETAAAWNPAAVAAAKRALQPPGLAAGLRREAGGFVASVSGRDAMAMLRDFTSASDNEQGRTPWRDRTILPRAFSRR